MIRLFRAVGFLAVVWWAVPGWAAALVDRSTGDVRAGASVAAAAPVRAGQRLEAGTVLVTGPSSNVVLRFDDGQAMYLHEKTQFSIERYSFTRSNPAGDSFVFSLVKGALRSVTAAFTRRNKDAYALKLPQATIGIRGTDFMVMIMNPAYLSVNSGAVAAINSAGQAVFNAGSLGIIPSPTVLAAGMPLAAMPGPVVEVFSAMGALPMGAAAGAGAATTPGAAGASGAAAGGGITGGVAAGAVAGMGVAGAIVSGSDDNTTGTTGTTGTTETYTPPN
jgi:hypothetical protein